MIRKCQHCKTRYSHDKKDVDYVHECNSDNLTLDNEDHFDITTNPLIGYTNKLQGTDANIQNKKRLLTKTTRNNNELTHFTRQRFVHIDFKKGTTISNPLR